RSESGRRGVPGKCTRRPPYQSRHSRRHGPPGVGGGGEKAPARVVGGRGFACAGEKKSPAAGRPLTHSAGFATAGGKRRYGRAGCKSRAAVELPPRRAVPVPARPTAGRCPTNVASRRPCTFRRSARVAARERPLAGARGVDTGGRDPPGVGCWVAKSP